MRKVTSSLCLTLLLSSCGLTGLNPFSGKGGPTVNANVLAGKENTQQVVAQQNRQDENTQQVVAQQNRQDAGRDIIQTEIQKDVEAKTVEEVKITNTNVPIWVILLLLLGWLLPTPSSMGMWLGDMFMRMFRWRKE